MRNRQLHDALHAFAVEAAALLREDQQAGAELDFDLDEGSTRGGPTLYHYRPLTARFVAERWPRLRCLPTCPAAAAALGAGAAAYLRVNGLRGAEAEPALQAMLERLYEDATDLSFPQERFERVYDEVERTLFERSQPATVLVPVHGLELDSDRVELGDGLTLARGELAGAPEEAVWGGPGRTLGADDPHDPNVLLMLERDVTPDDPSPIAEARVRFRRLLTGLRLWKRGGVALGAVAWRRTGDGRWQAFELEQTGIARAEPWILVEGEDTELREFLAALEDSAPGGSVAWALSRFEMGVGRELEAEALSDYLLALRALVDPDEGSGRQSLALRVAVLCAAEGERRSVQRRVELAQALERFVMGDPGRDSYLDAVGPDSPRTLVDEVERHLRALLRDVICGFLEADLRAVSDELLLDRAPAAPAPVPPPEAVPTTFAASRNDEPPPEEVESVTSEIETLEASGDEIGVEDSGADSEPLWDDAPVAEWDDYSAPV